MELNRKILLPTIELSLEILLEEAKHIYTEATELDVSTATIQSLKWLDWCKHNSSCGRNFLSACEVSADISTRTHQITINRRHHGETTWLKNDYQFAKLFKVILHELNHIVWDDHGENFYYVLRKTGIVVGEPNGSFDSSDVAYLSEDIPFDSELYNRIQDIRTMILEKIL